MYLFSSVHYCTGLCINGCVVLILSCAHIVHVHCTSQKSTSLGKELNSNNQHLEVDYQIPKGPVKCCGPNDWLDYSSDKRPLCVGLPPDILRIASNSSWLGAFSEFGALFKPFCSSSESTLVWKKSNARDNIYHSENKSVFNLASKTNYYIYCGDYINLPPQNDSLFEIDKNAENLKKLENEISGVLLCSIHVEDVKDKIRNFLSVYGMSISTVFLAITFYLYLSTPKLRRKLYDKCFLCQLASFIIAFSFTIWRKQVQYKQDEPAPFCTFIAFMNQYWLLSAFSWLTILCIDLWRAISAKKKCNLSDAVKLMIYCLCAWGFPLLMSLATFGATWLEDTSFFKVDFNLGICWFYMNPESSFFMQPEFIYFYSYLSLTVLINVCLFIHIASIIVSRDYCWRNATDSRKHEANKKRLLLYLKLFLTMGLTWILEIIVYYVDSKDNGWIWLLPDLQLSLLQSIFIFVISVSNNRVKEILKKRFFSNQKESLKSLTSTLGNGNAEKSAKALLTEVRSVSLRSMKAEY